MKDDTQEISSPTSATIGSLDYPVVEAAMKLYETQLVYDDLARAGGDNPESLMLRNIQRQLDIGFTELLLACKAKRDARL